MKQTLVSALCVGVCLALGATASEAQPRQATVSRAISQPFRDLNLVRENPEAVLRLAATAPYARPMANGVMDCSSVVSEIVALDLVLGPDIDLPRPRQNNINFGGLVAGAVRDAVSLPYRGVIRRITGAERRDREMEQAIQAGTLRRAYLKGLRANECANYQAVRTEQHASLPQGEPALAQPEYVADAPEEAPVQASAQTHAASRSYDPTQVVSLWPASEMRAANN